MNYAHTQSGQIPATTATNRSQKRGGYPSMKTMPRCATCAAFDPEPGLCRRTSPSSGGFPPVKNSDWCLQHQSKADRDSLLASLGWREEWGDPTDLLAEIHAQDGWALADICYHLQFDDTEQVAAMAHFIKNARNLGMLHQNGWVFTVMPTRAELEAMKAEKGGAK